jgi:hypothetical protein
MKTISNANRRLRTMAAKENYKCIVCGTHDPDLFARCYHPMCPDGHDQPGRFPSYPPAPLSLETRKSGRVVLLVILFAVISLIYACTSQIVLR